MINKTLLKTALGLALAGMATIPSAATLTENYYTETALTLDAKWTLLGTTSGISVSHDGSFWDVTSLSIATGNYMGFPVWGTSVSAFHDEAPHGSDSSTGNVFNSNLAGTWPQTSSYTATVPHPSLHSDIYTFEAVASGTGSGAKVEISLHAVHAVPEPETYAMMLAGLGLVGMIARRRRFQIG